MYVHAHGICNMYGCGSGKMHGGNQGAKWMEVIERSTGTAVIHWFGVVYVLSVSRFVLVVW